MTLSKVVIMKDQIKQSMLKELEFDLDTVDKLWVEDKKNARDVILERNMLRSKDLAKEIEDEAVTNGNLRKYCLERMLPAEKGGYFVVRRGKLEYKSPEAWANFKERIENLSKPLYKKIVSESGELYRPEVFPCDVVIDRKGKTVNVAKVMNCRYTKENVDEKNGKILIQAMKEIFGNDNEEQWNAFKYFFSCVLHYRLSGWILFLQGQGGIGKSFFMDEIMGFILGHAKAQVKTDLLVGAEKFNGELQGTPLAVIEETAGNGVNATLMQAMKTMTTSPVMTIRHMYAAGTEVRNVINLAVLSNHFRDLDCSDRRVFVPTLNNKYQGNTKFFSDLMKCRTPESLQYVFNYFYEFDSSKYMQPPLTEAKADYKEANMDLPLHFLVDEYMICDPRNKRELKLREAYSQYELWSANNKKNKWKSDTFYQCVRGFVTSAKRDDGTDKTKGGSLLYDFSFSALYDKIITRSKVMTETQFKERVTEYKELKIDEIETVFDDKSKRIEELEKENEQLKKKLEELAQKLEEKEKEKKEEKETEETEEETSEPPVERKTSKYEWFHLIEGFND